MRLSDAIATGRVLVKPLAGVVLRDNKEEGCAIGMALVACGKQELAHSYDGLGQAWPWTTNRLDPICLPCGCGKISAISDCNVIGSAIAHLFDFHIADRGRARWTLDQLIDWVRSVEPAESEQTASQPASEPSFIEVSI